MDIFVDLRNVFGVPFISDLHTIKKKDILFVLSSFDLSKYGRRQVRDLETYLGISLENDIGDAKILHIR